MNELLALNKSFLTKAFFWISGILSGLFSLYVYFFYAEITSKWMLIIYSFTLIILPLFIISVWSFDWFRKRRYKKRILAKKPFSALETIGFTHKVIKSNHNSLVDYAHIAEINECQIVFDVEINKPKIATFTIYGRTSHLTTKEYVQKAMDYEYSNIEFSPSSFTKKINTKNETIQSVQQLQSILQEFTHIVKKEKYEPIVITDTMPI
ncbi:hypothetical protein [uncultured Kordia sp.]|uniref:hypothetical protein n=1 Tax=uncultured Kordia sp. TaxID=507699 RepID=UPI00262BD08C|nr:hypothetical protein [uncultured Kordia sp.]